MEIFNFSRWSEREKKSVHRSMNTLTGMRMDDRSEKYKFFGGVKLRQKEHLLKEETLFHLSL